MNVKRYRESLGLTQAQFWEPLGITQSGGSRYESGRDIWKPVQTLLDMRYGTDKQARQLFADLRRK